ncbi:phosphatase PAP2 family protein [Haloechinothrix sp. LS1_15]|uniref:phosphatase PAP2 family protein n=1 Tax=Haloechinothrix sp. LS1_15 TaxID=2652248 RepID=UPI002945366A|nr:phosphatase PAP2 family protein [Haloechinothrix sp. LS1_15]MDV6013590.1 phosphatase PAP2 family protein [Haloechinothrix sp. LS1_15]
MDTLWEAEIAPVVWVQGWGDWLELPMAGLSALGSQFLYLALAPLVFWSISASLGARLYVLLMASAAVNMLLKSLVYGPRPYWLSPQVTQLATESSFGVPSGHAQMSATMWGYLAAMLRRRWFWVVAVFLIAGITLSRLYLGVHFISDLLVGLVLGVGIVWLALRYQDRVIRWWQGWSLRGQLVMALGISLVAPLIAVSWQAIVRTDWTAPASWTGAVPDDVVTGGISVLFQVSGVLLGLLVALSLLWARGWYSAAGSIRVRVLRGVLGLAGMAAMVALLRVTIPDLAGEFGYARDYLSGMLTMLWGFFVLPELFIRLKLATRGEPDVHRASAEAR